MIPIFRWIRYFNAFATEQFCADVSYVDYATDFTLYRNYKTEKERDIDSFTLEMFSV